jgi:hypothetical protein
VAAYRIGEVQVRGSLQCEISARLMPATGHFRLSCLPTASFIHVGCSPDSGGAVHGRLLIGQCHKRL